MRRDWFFVIVLAVCFILLVAALFFMESVGDGVQQGRSNLNKRDGGVDVGSDVVIGGFDGGGVGGVDGEAVVGLGEVDVVPNISAGECGFYFESYGVCDGVCPDGECVSEGRSCYCKSV